MAQNTSKNRKSEERENFEQADNTGDDTGRPLNEEETKHARNEANES